MQIYPIGMVNNFDSTATLDTNGQKFTMWEPNNGCQSYSVYSTLRTRFENQTILARKKAEPYLVINYNYKNIWDREIRNVEWFVDKMDGELNSFYVVDWSKGETPSSITTSWVININRTRIYSTTSNYKSNYAFVWDGNNFKCGQVSNISSFSSITISQDYGDLTATLASSRGMVYPVYECYFSENPMPNFKPGQFIPDTVASVECGGYLWTGDTSFTSKYKT